MAFDLIVLGRQLTRIGETVMRGQAPPSQPTLAGMVLADVFAHPQSSISEITARVGMPQSHVSETVARMREQGTVETFRTLPTAAAPWCASAPSIQRTSCAPRWSQSMPP